MNLVLRPPTSKRLDYWLDNKPAKFERYLAAHPEVADRFEAANPLAGLAENVRDTLSAAIAAPIDLAARLRERLLSERDDTSPLAVALDLGTLGAATLSMLAGPLMETDS
jgi:hypothetical protein